MQVEPPAVLVFVNPIFSKKKMEGRGGEEEGGREWREGERRGGIRGLRVFTLRVQRAAGGKVCYPPPLPRTRQQMSQHSFSPSPKNKRTKIFLKKEQGG